MGGGTGTGGGPIVGEIARELGALTVGIVTKPFSFEGRRRMRQCEEGLEQLREVVDTLIVIPNQRLLHVVDRNTPLNEALRVADDVLAHATKGISEIITVPGLINVDFADVRSVMRGMGNALMGMGFGHGPDRAREAAQMAISSPLLEDISISGARALLVNFMGGEEMTLAEVDEASNHILQAAGEDANVIFGSVVDPRITDEIRVTLIATGFGDEKSGVAGASAVREAERILSVDGQVSSATSSEGEASHSKVLHSIGVSASSESSEMDLVDTPEPVGAAATPIVLTGAAVPGGSTGHTQDLEPVSAEYAGAGGPSNTFERAPACEDGILGPARPIQRIPLAQPTTGMQAPPPRGASMLAPGVPPATAGGASVARAGAEIPENVVPLVWKKNLHGGEWKPTMSSRWQRVLRRDRLDVPSFLRRRQVD
ncbi:MAG: cell division protein FtsZ, partial [Candidatus Eisenbacteria sp.]|nr:cell division protein FtsZ [Candidatus Eisenbacteria bacterium]